MSPTSGGASPQMEFPRILRVTDTRIAICGRLGHPAPRAMGAWLFYVALHRPFSISLCGGTPETHTLALVPPWMPHHVTTLDRDIAMVIVEPESVDGSMMASRVMGTAAARRESENRLQAAFRQSQSAWTEFDEQFFGAPLPSMRLNQRLRQAIDHIVKNDGATVGVADCAENARISESRLMHLFDEQLGITFRRFRNWRRARNLLTRLDDIPRLIDVALDAGYSDATQFGQHVRSCYGYTPKVMFTGSRQFSVIQTSRQVLHDSYARFQRNGAAATSRSSTNAAVV